MYQTETRTKMIQNKKSNEKAHQNQNDTYLNNYFRLHVCLSVRPSVRTYVRTSHFHFFRIPAVVSQNVTNKSCLACVKSEKYVVWVTLRPLGSMRQCEAEVRIEQYQAR